MSFNGFLKSAFEASFPLVLHGAMSQMGRTGRPEGWLEQAHLSSITAIAISVWLASFMLPCDANYYYFRFILIKSVQTSSTLNVGIEITSKMRAVRAESTEFPSMYK